MEEFKEKLMKGISLFCDTEGYKFLLHTPLEALFLCGFRKIKQISIKNYGYGLRAMRVIYEGEDGRNHEVELTKGYYENDF